MGAPVLQYCTYFDENYLLKGIALCKSLFANEPGAELWVLCLDAATERLLRHWQEPQVKLVTLAELETWEPRLLEARVNRSRVEYYWTCTPTLLAYVLAKQGFSE